MKRPEHPDSSGLEIAGQYDDLFDGTRDFYSSRAGRESEIVPLYDCDPSDVPSASFMSHDALPVALSPSPAMKHHPASASLYGLSQEWSSQT